VSFEAEPERIWMQISYANAEDVGIAIEAGTAPIGHCQVIDKWD